MMSNNYKKVGGDYFKSYFTQCLCGENKIYHYALSCNHMYCDCYNHEVEIQCDICLYIIPFFDDELRHRNNIEKEFMVDHPIKITNDIITDEIEKRNTLSIIHNRNLQILIEINNVLRDMYIRLKIKKSNKRLQNKLLKLYRYFTYQ